MCSTLLHRSLRTASACKAVSSCWFSRGTQISRRMSRGTPRDLEGYSMNFPGHRYLGPGNPVPNGPPVDEDDRIAQEHDELHNAARNTSDIREADRIVISNFSTEFANTRNYHSLVGFIKFTFKYGAESIPRVQYPRNLPPPPKDSKDHLKEARAVIASRNTADDPRWVMDRHLRDRKLRHLTRTTKKEVVQHQMVKERSYIHQYPG
ncbi:hypothetical protein J6590_081429 [Homalodisca vitripennis]|nr:hypothetical protein J6590_081429 [Homalodisca vitripennis]